MQVKGHSRSSEPTHTYRSAIYDFLLTFYSNHWPIWHRFRDRWRSQAKIDNFSSPVYFALPLKGQNWVSTHGVKKLEWCYRAEQEVWQHRQPSGYNIPGAVLWGLGAPPFKRLAHCGPQYAGIKFTQAKNQVFRPAEIDCSRSISQTWFKWMNRSYSPCVTDLHEKPGWSPFVDVRYCNKVTRSANTWLIGELIRLLQVSPRSASFLCVDQPHSSRSAINRSATRSAVSHGMTDQLSPADSTYPNFCKLR